MQVMGGDALTPFYPVEAVMKVSKIENIAGGTMEACRLVIFRTAVRQWADEFRMRRRVMHEKLGVPVPAAGPPERLRQIDEEQVLALLAEDYRVNPGLHMSMADLRQYVDVEHGRLEEVLGALESKGLVKLYRGKKGIELAKATYDGLDKAHPAEYYRWYPSWITKERIF